MVAINSIILENNKITFPIYNQYVMAGDIVNLYPAIALYKGRPSQFLAALGKS